MTDRTAGIRQKIADDLAEGPAWARSYTHCRSILLSMIDAGDVTRTKPEGGKRHNMIALTEQGAARYVPDRSDVMTVEPQLQKSQRGKGHSRKHDPARASRLRDRLAELVANDHSIRSAARTMQISQSYASSIWRDICAGLGWQAQ